MLVPSKAIKATTGRVFVIPVAEGIAEWVDLRRGGAAEGDLIEVFGNLRAGGRIFERASGEVRSAARVASK